MQNLRAEPNVTPMIDVMLVLLIIFMLVVPSIDRGFRAEPPRGAHLRSRPESEDEVVLGIDAAGRLYLGRRPIRPDQLGAELARAFAARPLDHVLYVRADRDVAYGVVREAMDVAGRSGARVIGAIAEPELDRAVPAKAP